MASRIPKSETARVLAAIDAAVAKPPPTIDDWLPGGPPPCTKYPRLKWRECEVCGYLFNTMNQLAGKYKCGYCSADARRIKQRIRRGHTPKFNREALRCCQVCGVEFPRTLGPAPTIDDVQPLMACARCLIELDGVLDKPYVYPNLNAKRPRFQIHTMAGMTWL